MPLRQGFSSSLTNPSEATESDGSRGLLFNQQELVAARAGLGHILITFHIPFKSGSQVLTRGFIGLGGGGGGGRADVTLG